MTMTPWSILSWWLEVLKHGKSIATPDEDEPENRVVHTGEPGIGVPDDEDIDEQPEDGLENVVPGGLRSVGAWTGWGSFVKESYIERDIAFCKRLGLGRIDVIVNDHSAKRSAQKFGTYNKKNITAFCKRAVDEGFAVHLMTWWMPHRKYIIEGGKQLTDLAGECGARSIMIDAEEPWVLGRQPRLSWEDGGDLTAEVLSAVPFGVTGIGYASSKKLGPLVRHAAYMVPQCYSTAGNKINPNTASVRLSNGWRRKFGDRELVVGLAGYRQLDSKKKPRPGYTKESFMRAAFNNATQTGATDIVYWSLRQIRGNRTTANLIQKLAANATMRAAEGNVA